MKFLLDAQLPPSLKEVFISKGYYCIHTIDLDLGNNTPDKVINELSINENLVLITKDSDFYESFIIKNEPYKLTCEIGKHLQKGFDLLLRSSFYRNNRKDKDGKYVAAE